MRIWLVLLGLIAASHAAVELSCPTMGTLAYIVVTVSDQLAISGFASLLQYYGTIMPDRGEEITYLFNFGTNYTTTLYDETDLQKAINAWIDDTDYLNQIWQSSMTKSHEAVQYDNSSTNSVVGVVNNMFVLIASSNQNTKQVFKKKQVVIISDYIPANATSAINDATAANVQRIGIFYGLNTTQFQQYAKFPIFSVLDDDHLSSVRSQVQSNIHFEFPSNVHQVKPTADNYLFLTLPDTTAIQRVIDSTIFGDMCALSGTKMYDSYVKVHFAFNNTVNDLILPWLGNETQKFSRNCIAYYGAMEKNVTCSASENQIVSDFLDVAHSQGNLTFVTLISDDRNCTLSQLFNGNISLGRNTHARVVFSEKLNDLYEEVTIPLIKSGFINNNSDNEVLTNNEFYLTNYTTTCVSLMPFVPLTSAYPYFKPKYLHIALDDMLWITVCATISVSTFGCIIYNRVKRRQKKQMALINEVMLQPRVFSAAKECPTVARLPWEIKSDRVYIDKEFMLGEGTVSNVYLGKLKGKAPIMQWIDRVEMKQYQDCAVAVRVPRHFDEPEEDQLFREIASMRRLRHHDHIALLLGWTNKNDLVCSLLELTHMNLVKYLSQIKETTTNSTEVRQSTKYIPFQILYKIIWEICDGMAYIHSRNLVHRDLTARNVLLTTGLRAKISGFGFCSEIDDPKFGDNAPALRFLPVRWMAPECFQGRFVLNSDVWSFGVTLFEIFTLGDVPYTDLRKPEDIVESVRKGRIPACPKYSNKSTYKVLQRCCHQFPERRPTFNQLKDKFAAEEESFYDNMAFEGDEFTEISIH